jgi:hypothetical protein
VVFIIGLTRLAKFKAKDEYRTSHTYSMVRTKRNLLTQKLAKPLRLEPRQALKILGFVAQARKSYLRISSAVLLLVFLLTSHAQAAGEITINTFSLSPNVVANNTGSTQFWMILGATVDIIELNKTCDINERTLRWFLHRGGSDVQKKSGEKSFDRTSETVNVIFDQSITIDTKDGNQGSNQGVATYYVRINCKSGSLSSEVARSASFTVTFGSATDRTHACVGADNKYACSPANLSNCSDVPACAGKQCIEIGKNLCGKDAGTGGVQKYSCNSDKQCIPNPSGTYTTSNCDNKCDQGGGKTTTTAFEFKNPIEAENLIELLDVIATWLFNISIPIMVAMILYAGVTFLISRGEPAKLTQAKNILLYAVVGFAIILIGKGFITLIESILNLGTGP